jgi:hypothetical protein
LDDDAVAASHGDELPDEGQCETDPAEPLKKGLCKVGGQAVDLLYDLVGETYDAAMKNIGQNTPLPAIVWAEVDGLDAVGELVRLLSMHKAVVPAKDSEGWPPEVVLRSQPRKKRTQAGQRRSGKSATKLGNKRAQVRNSRALSSHR